jgi:hypothetical protein
VHNASAVSKALRKLMKSRSPGAYADRSGTIEGARPQSH